MSLLRRIIHHHEEMLGAFATQAGQKSRGFTLKDINLIIAGNVEEFAVPKRWVFFPQLQQTSQMIKNLLLLRSPATLLECISLVSGKAAGKITPVIGVVSARHTYFISTINLWNAAHCCQEREGEF